MASTDLREFISALERAGELRRVTSEVDPILEITEITDRVSKAGGPALLFEHVKGASMPVLINAFGSPTRMNLALQVASPGDLAAELQEVLDLKAPEGLLGKLRMLPKLQDLAGAFPKLVKDGPCKEVVVRDNPSLAGIPVLQCRPADAGRHITFPLVFTQDPETGVPNCGAYRMQVFDERTTGMHWHVQKGGGAHRRADIPRESYRGENHPAADANDLAGHAGPRGSGLSPGGAPRGPSPPPEGHAPFASP
ncbi:MAG: UbiD family decarboxylase [candidate division NC10 bacterium]|nr:UbiD family decarboxylase [candidate division NC10 bacterium]